MDKIWHLADDWEERWRDRANYGPSERYFWKKAWQELVDRLGERVMPRFDE